MKCQTADCHNNGALCGPCFDRSLALLNQRTEERDEARQDCAAMRAAKDSLCKRVSSLESTVRSLRAALARTKRDA